MDSYVNTSINPATQANAHGEVLSLPAASGAPGANDGILAQVSNNPFFTAVSSQESISASILT